MYVCVCCMVGSQMTHPSTNYPLFTHTLTYYHTLKLACSRKRNAWNIFTCWATSKSVFRNSHCVFHTLAHAHTHSCNITSKCLHIFPLCRFRWQASELVLRCENTHTHKHTHALWWMWQVTRPKCHSLRQQRPFYSKPAWHKQKQLVTLCSMIWDTHLQHCVTQLVLHNGMSL